MSLIYHDRNRDIYDTYRWRKLSREYRALNPLCETCLKFHRYIPVDVCDHIIEIEDDKSLAFDSNNLKSQCHSCHNLKTAKAKKARRGMQSKKGRNVVSLE